MNTRTFLMLVSLVALVFPLSLQPAHAQLKSGVIAPKAEAFDLEPFMGTLRKVTQADREAAAERAREAKEAEEAKAADGGEKAPAALAVANAVPGGVPDYFTCANWTNSPLPTVDPISGAITGGIRKFVDSLPGLTSANQNNLGQYIPIANADTTTYPNSDYYEIAVVEYTEQLHRDLGPTRLRGYVQLNNGTDAVTGLNTVAPAPVHYLGPLILAHKDRPVRVKFTNLLPTGTGGDLFLPVDTTVMGAGMGPIEMPGMPGMMEEYKQNRATLHLHGGNTPWISDGTAHQWTTPAGEMTSYPKGVSTQNVPDMPDPGEGSMTFYYTNQQSARLLFYHDHSWGITRLNVYAGEAAGYLITDPAEEALISSGKIPDLGGVYHWGVPLIIQDKTFVPDAAALAATDPTWDTVKWGGPGNLWFPHVYMPNQNPADLAGINPYGRWDYGPWFWPVWNMVANGPITLPSGIQIPGVPNVSMTMEAFMDTPVVNGTAYPFIPVGRRAYRFRILNACDDRFLNLQLYYADPTILPGTPGYGTEVKMVPANPNPAFPAYWPTMDGRDGGVPDPVTAGPNMIQIGTEGGFLPAPVELPNTPVGYDMDRRSITVLNVLEHTLFLGPAERADVIIDFSQVPSGSNLILYNDAPAPVPAADPRLDYFTGHPDMTATGGAPPTLPGYGPNTRTIMQFRVSGAAAPAFDLAGLQAAFASTPTSQGVFAASQDPIIVPQAPYNSAYNGTFPADTSAYGRIFSNSMTFTPLGATVPTTLALQPKAIQELFETDYGRMNSTLGVELPFTNANNQTTVPMGFREPATEILQDGETQIWKITHNGVDTHAIHFHLFDAQIINRVDWAGVVKPPEANELGWKDTVRMNPLEDCIVAMRARAQNLPWAIPESVRPLDPSMPLGATFQGWHPLTGMQYTVVNEMANFGWEYVWHCHLLGHEEMDMMRPLVLQVPQVPPAAASGLTATVAGPPLSVVLTWTNNANNATGFRIERSTNGTAYTPLVTVGPVSTYADASVLRGTKYWYRVIAYNLVGSAAASNVVTVTTSTMPAAPVSLNATATPPSINTPTVTFTWTDRSNNETGFTIQRALDPNFTLLLNTFNVGANIVSYLDTTVGPMGTYYYRVCSYNFLGNSAWSATRSVATPGLLPRAPTALAATVMGPFHVNLSWTDNANNETGFRVERATATSAFAPLQSVAANVKVLTDLTALASTTYRYRVFAFTVTGDSTASNVVTVTTPALTPPTAPSSLVATASVLSASPPTVSLTWVDNSNSEANFTIQRARDVAFTLGLTTFTVGINVTTYTDAAVAQKTVYYYRVRANNAIGSSAWAAAPAVTTPGQLPAAPTTLATGTITRNSIALTWKDNATNETGFYVERSTAGLTGPWTRIATVPANATAYTNTALINNKIYWYQVRAYNASGTSAYTNVVAGTTLK